LHSSCASRTQHILPPSVRRYRALRSDNKPYFWSNSQALSQLLMIGKNQNDPTTTHRARTSQLAFHPFTSPIIVSDISVSKWRHHGSSTIFSQTSLRPSRYAHTQFVIQPPFHAKYYLTATPPPISHLPIPLICLFPIGFLQGWSDLADFWRYI